MNAIVLFFKKHRDLSETVIQKREFLAQNPYLNALGIRLLWLENQYRLWIDKYRILYKIIEKQILMYVYGANFRGDVYK